MTDFASRFFLSVGRTAARFPRFKGKDGAFLRLFDALGLKSQHVLVDTWLNRPIRYRVRLDLHSWLQRLAFVSGEYEASTVSFLLKLHDSVEKPGYVLDIGANIGLIAIPAALMMKKNADTQACTPCVICVEAVPDNEKSLRHNIMLNNAREIVSVIGTGLGETAGTAEIQVEGDLKIGEGSGTANILPAGSILDPNGTYECVKFAIPITTLDTLMESSDLPAKCTVVKIDTDGYDLKILKGGRLFLERNRPVIFGEFAAHCMKWHGESVVDVVRFAESLNYLVRRRVPGKDHKFTRSIDADSFSQDLLLFPAEYANQLAWCCQS